MAVIEDITKIEPYLTDENGDHQKISYQTQFNTVVNSDGTTLDDKLKQIDGTTLIGTLMAGQTEIIFEDDAITTDKTYDYYTDVYGISALNIDVINGKITMEFPIKKTDIKIKVVIK